MEFNIAVVRKVAAIMAEEVRRKLEEGGQILEMEQGLRELAQQVCGQGLQKVIEAQEEKYPIEIRCSCGYEAKAWGQREAVVWSVFGKVEYRRRYYLCPHCHRGQSPLDEQLGLAPGQSTLGLASLLGILGVETSFEEASEIAETLPVISLER